MGYLAIDGGISVIAGSWWHTDCNE